jgi:outer membrane protein insertion porin family
VPSSASINVLNSDGSPRQQRNLDANGNLVLTNVTQNIPVYQLVTPGGDTQVVTNFEYRIPIFGPVTLAAFFDAGVDKLAFYNQLKLNPDRIATLNAQFPEAAFLNRAVIAPHTQQARASTGLELQVLLPVVNAPFRVYYAYNPLLVREFLQPPIVADRSYFPNAATFANALQQFGQALPFFEKRGTFRFTIGRTF